MKSVQILIFSGTYFPVFSPNTGKYRPKKTPYLETFHTVIWEMKYVAFWEETNDSTNSPILNMTKTAEKMNFRTLLRKIQQLITYYKSVAQQS